MTFLIGMILLIQQAWAHPVAFQGSVGIMGYHSSDMADQELNYSVRHWWAPSVQMMRLKPHTSRQDVFIGKVNFLVKRWNGEAYQANIYAHAGGGRSRLSGAWRGVGHGGITADIEDRRFYFLAEANGLRNSSRNEFNFWKARAGFAPYITGFEGIHSWIILEANRKSLGTRAIQLVPTLRFFYQNVLWEFGYSLKGDLHFNYIIHI